MISRLNAILSIGAVSLFLACAPAYSDTAAAKPSAAKKKTEQKAAKAPVKTIFDLSHAEIFSPVKEGDLNYTSFYEAFRKNGGEAGVNKEPVSSKSLAKAKTYVIAGPSQGFTMNEIAALDKFVSNGGNLLVLLHISSPVAQLTNSFGITVSNFVIGEQSDLIEGKAQDFYVTRFGPHPVTEGLGKIAVYGSWGLMAEDPALVVGATSAKAWADMDRNRKFDKGEPMQDFGIIAVNEHGKGKVVVIADDAPFSNRFITEADNKLLAENIIRWFK